MGTCSSKTVNVTRDCFDFTQWKISECVFQQRWEKLESKATQTEPVIFDVLKKCQNVKPGDIHLSGALRDRLMSNISTQANTSQVSLVSSPCVNAGIVPLEDILLAIDRLQDLCGRVGMEDQVAILCSIGYLRNHCHVIANKSEKGTLSSKQNGLATIADDPEVGFWLETFNGKKQPLVGIRRFKKVALAVKTAVTMAGPSFSNNSPRPVIQLDPIPAENHTQYLKDNIRSWDFDQFEFDRLSNHRGISVLMKEILMTTHLITEFRIDCVKLKKFCMALEEGYDLHKNPYHNEIHGADVLQTVFFIATDTHIVDWLSHLELLSVLFAAAIHDVEHTGTNNVFHQTTSSSLAILYNDKSILENHHISAAYRLLSNPDLNPFQSMSTVQFKNMRSMVIECVLATDMAAHFDQIENLKNMIDPALITQQDVMNVILHCADISAPGKPWDIHRRWTELLMQEFFAQGDREKELNVLISPLCDRYTTSIPESQIGFITYITVPAFKAMGDIIDNILREKHEADFLNKSGNPMSQSRRKSFIQNSLTPKASIDFPDATFITPVEEPSRRKTSARSKLLLGSNVSGFGHINIRNFSYVPIERPWDEHFQKNHVRWREEYEHIDSS